jgi:hypothetical protein
MKAKSFGLAFFALIGLALSVGAQQPGWAVRVIPPKKDYLPSEPIVVRLEMQNLGPAAQPYFGFQGAFYLDQAPQPCLSAVRDMPLFPPAAGVSEGPPPPPEPAGSLHAAEVEVSTTCNLQAMGSGLTGPHQLCYKVPPFKGLPAMEGCAEFTIVRPIGADAEAYRYFKGEPLKHGEEVIKKFPTSNYAALALWEQGLKWYTRALPEKGPEGDLNFGKTADYRECPNCDCQRDFGLCPITRPWEKLYRDFPSFGLRAHLLFNLSRCYFLMGARPRGVPLLKELLSKFPDSEPGKKAAAYRDVLKMHGLWPE